MAEPAGSALPLDRLAAAPLAPRYSRGWRIGVALSGALVAVLVAALAYTTWKGIGTWGTNIPFVWGFDLANYAWWIGVANGTSLLATLLVLWRSPVRLAINRFAETLALAGAICAALFPVFHLGKPWLAYWMAPIPGDAGLWPQPISPLTWDFWGIMAHLIAVALFWYIGVLPDVGLLRDRAKPGRRKRIYGVLALGWNGSDRQWALQTRTHRLLAISVIPFLFAMQTIVALELAVTIVPDWHDTALPVRFVIGGLSLGIGVSYFFAAVFAETFGLGEERRLLDRLGKIALAAALTAAFVVALTTLIEWLGPPRMNSALAGWTTGAGAPLIWTGLVLGKLVPQLLWFDRVRRNPLAAAAIGLALAIGVWFDFLAVFVIGIARDRLIDPAELYMPNLTEFAILFGSIGLFALIALVFARTLPIVSIYETRGSDEELLA